MEKLVIIVGLTSSGKSSLAIELAGIFGGEIVSADSRQVYRGLDYCSGKVSKDEQERVPHHLIDIVNLGEQFNLFDFQKMAYREIDGIISRGKLPLLVGGTGLYTRAVKEGYSLSEAPPAEKLREELSKLTVAELEEICARRGIDASGEQTARRLIRLIEKDGQTAENKPRYNVLQIGIRFTREQIYERIRLRLLARMDGMIAEIKGLLAAGTDKDFLLSLGLEAKHIIKYLDGEYGDFDEFFETLFKEERHFAKRQQTWYNKEKDLIWIDGDENLLKNAVKIVQNFLNDE